MSVPVRLGVIDDQCGFTTSALRGYLAPHPEITIVATAETVPELLTCGATLDVVMLDLLLADGTSPIENATLLRERGWPVLVFTGGEDPELVRMAARAGVAGIVLKSASEDRIVAAIRAVARGEESTSLELAAVIDADPAFAPTLPPQQQRTLALYASGESERDIAAIMNISPHTVKEYLTRIRSAYAELGQSNLSRSELTRAARLGGFVRRPWSHPRRSVR
ncbi:sigma factor-like helix-turn-helix DNA-binding protein [Nocardia camponoti]|uniref:Response regulatory domain-containing protein n=1 Tax=Nocardia camponoti TaxID=1616106 RepID=A0A917Q7E1_9NOCA|nr:response regulator transcription factor [Nocardia camponoti]GGK32702.1 hypothetical protein GCM10011591_00520 [Nocardia camponoti]